MKNQLLFFALMLGLLSCVSNEVKENEQVEQPKSEGQELTQEKDENRLSATEEKEITEKLTKEFLILYDELNSFKRNKEFHSLGFGIGSPYKKWWDRVDLLNSHPNSKILLKKGATPGDLQTLATEYLQSKGLETEYSKFMNAELKRVK
jgi:hypothetical protein